MSYSRLCCLSGLQRENQRKRKERQVFKPCQRTKKAVELESDGDTNWSYGGARGVMVIVVGNGHGDTSSNPGRDWLHFT